MTAGGLPIEDLVDDFERSLRAQNKARKTIVGYTDAARRYAAWAADNDHPTDHLGVQKADIETWIIDQLAEWTPSTAATRYRYFQQFWRWVVDEGEREVSPMAGMKAPQLPEDTVPVYVDDEMRRLIKACEGKDFEGRRDVALVRMFRATGVRLGEMASMNLPELDRGGRQAKVWGKGRRSRWAPYGDKAATALDRYLRERRRQPMGHLDALWIGQRGALTESGITQVLRRRAKSAGLTDIRPHRFRHDAAHRAKLAGMSEEELMVIFGWRSREMPARYGASAKAERARARFQAVDIEGDL